MSIMFLLEDSSGPDSVATYLFFYEDHLHSFATFSGGTPMKYLRISYCRNTF